MKISAAAAGLALLLAAPVWAQTAPPTPAASAIDPVKLDLARQLFETEGGRNQVEAQMDAIYSGMFTRMAAALPKEQQASAIASQKAMQDGVRSLIPSLIEVMVQVYARSYTEQEMRDLLAFRQTSTGQAVIKKTPLILREAMIEMVPLIMAEMPNIMRSTVDAVCEQQHCTPQTRKTMQAAIDKAFQPAVTPPAAAPNAS